MYHYRNRPPNNHAIMNHCNHLYQRIQELEYQNQELKHKLQEKEEQIRELREKYDIYPSPMLKLQNTILN
jgi:predicted RNase H-like nuclease (RuvC/YqgF family)